MNMKEMIRNLKLFFHPKLKLKCVPLTGVPADAVVGLVADVRGVWRWARIAPDGVRLAGRQTKLL